MAIEKITTTKGKKTTFHLFMKKYYTAPCAIINTFEFRDNIAIEGDPTIVTSMQLGKERDDELDNDDNYGNDNEWQNGLW